MDSLHTRSVCLGLATTHLIDSKVARAKTQPRQNQLCSPPGGLADSLHPPPRRAVRWADEKAARHHPAGRRRSVLLISLYVVAYLSLLVIRYPQRIIINDATGQILWGAKLQTEAEYRLGGEAAKTLFAPLEAIDRRLRPATWDPLKLYKQASALP